MNYEFWVYINVGRYDGGDVCVDADVSEEEVELLKKCYREDLEVERCPGLEGLVERVSAEAIDENLSIIDELDIEEELSPDEWSTTISIPTSIENMVDEEDEEAEA